ncbi:12115_t:CDS:2 [Gigaspora margarita]|uniref:12115_t:CDS:1 n=1 Tax=Gigaspora margarita TaxID=4874 RepID=A0ABM8W2L8_GIGMA|nr:12115_t:CDS:2 [Gigaspora margarita]
MCGFGDKDRRPIDPPPVVRLFVSFPDGTPESESSIDHTMMTVHAALWSEDRREERSLVINPSTIPGQATGPTSSIMSLNPPFCIKTLVGSCVSSAYLLRDHTDQRGIYFIFQDLSVRIEGTYTLKFSFTDLRGLISPTYEKVRGCVAAEVYSAPFRVYSAKKFPGMTESTALSKAFASQGIKLTIRKDFRYQRINNDPLDQMNEHTTITTTSTPSNIIKSDDPDNPDNLDNPDDDDEELDDLSHEEIKRER